MTRFTLATLQTSAGPRAAIGVDDSYYQLSEVSSDLRHASVKSLLGDWSNSFPKLETLADDIVSGRAVNAHGIPSTKADLLTPIMWPNKFICVGANYVGHLKEMGLSTTKWKTMPFFLSPPTTCLVGPGETVEIPKMTKEFDWELELAMVVGRRLRNATIEETRGAIAAYTIGLDLSCRDLTLVGGDIPVDLIRGKAQDTMAPCGPFIVPAKFLPDVTNLKLTLDVNGKQMMNSSTNEMLYSCEEMLATISEYVTLEPGDLIFTGSPSGSAGFHGGCWLKPGDEIHAEIEGIGAFDVRMKRH
jgi:2-keto-4-pentenoate hydratase/2-oxohepta-3-ene-1,7-dioic acid hydratase in catechol pathway